MGKNSKAKQAAKANAAARKEKDAEKEIQAKQAATPPDDPAEDEGDNTDAPTGGEDAPENNLTAEEIQAQKALNERMEAVMVAFSGLNFEVYEPDEGEDANNPLMSVLAEDDAQIIEGYLEELEALSKHVPTMLSAFDGAKYVTIDEELRDDGATVIRILKADGDTLADGSLEELLHTANEIAASSVKPEEDKPKRGKKKNQKVLEDFKIRNLPWRPLSVLRVVRDFDFDGKAFKRGEIFDWHALGYRRLSVKRLYAQRLIRHAVEDMGTAYPFRQTVEKIEKGGALMGWDKLPENLKPKKKTDSPESYGELGDYNDSDEMKERQRKLNRARHGIGTAAGTELEGKDNYGGQKKKNFSIKNDLSGE